MPAADEDDGSFMTRRQFGSARADFASVAGRRSINFNDAPIIVDHRLRHDPITQRSFKKDLGLLYGVACKLKAVKPRPALLVAQLFLKLGNGDLDRLHRNPGDVEPCLDRLQTRTAYAACHRNKWR